MKYIVLLGDGMPDEQIDALGGKTPLEFARTPAMDYMAKRGLFGLANTIPAGYPPGSDVANLSVFGYDPRVCYTGRSPLEAASMGVQLGENDVAFRMNLVYLAGDTGETRMADYSAGHITTEEGHELVVALGQALGNEEFEFHPGVSYRHLLVWRNGKDKLSLTPPHDISGRPIAAFLPTGDGAGQLLQLMNDSRSILTKHPLFKRRCDAGKHPANSIWLWGHGKAPRMETYREKFNLTGAVISAVDLIRGIGVCAGLEIIKVPGATGYLDTNYQGKVAAALAALEHVDYVYLHIEAPDESSHSGSIENKLQAIEDFDAKVVAPICEGIKKFGAYRILCTPDHPTPLSLMTHSDDPVPFIIYSGETAVNEAVAGYDEISAGKTGLVVEEGFRLMELLLQK
jgi:2,3-bisphosphoglycerate-independent phosphoglycerate mutase